jgi:hypothetical protein
MWRKIRITITLAPQEDARHRLRQEREHRGRAERVEPVGAVRDLAVEEAAQERAGAGALVHPSHYRDRDVLQRLGAALALGLGLLLAFLDERLAALAQVAVGAVPVPGRRRRRGILAAAAEWSG